jgi:hypothetical protein
VLGCVPLPPDSAWTKTKLRIRGGRLGAVDRGGACARDAADDQNQVIYATRALPKSVQKSIVDAFDSPDVINLPDGNTAWRACA